MSTNQRNWTSFNSGKLFAQVTRWARIGRDACPPPNVLYIEPASACNLACEWCNSSASCARNVMLAQDVMARIPDFVASWRACGYGIGAVVLTGGGEPLLHPYAGELMRALDAKGIKVSTLTNGTMSDRFQEDLLTNQYVGVSIDAATSATFNAMKGLDADAQTFDHVIANVEALCKAARNAACTLGGASPSNGVNYRMVLCKENVPEVAQAARIAQEIGCKCLHIRPAATPFGSTLDFGLDADDIACLDEQIREVEATKSPDFGFIYSTANFGQDLRKDNDFSGCHAIFVAASILPPRGDVANGFSLNVCCDRRDDPDFLLLRDATDVNDIAAVWGSPKHWALFDAITKDEIDGTCPRCRYYSHNKIFETCIQSDNLLLDFV